MDDNKTLTLINGDRIGMTEGMSLLFEVQDLAVASPATGTCYRVIRTSS
jgi:dynein heavy chain